MRRIFAVCVMSAVIGLPLLAPHCAYADNESDSLWNTNCARGDVNSQGLTDSDPGFVQDPCTPGVTTYYYDAHTGRCEIDCRP